MRCSDQHRPFQGLAQDKVEGEQDRDQQDVVGHQQQVKVEQAGQTTLLQQGKPVSGTAFQRWRPDHEDHDLDRSEHCRYQRRDGGYAV